jgi:hypothetical protein
MSFKKGIVLLVIGAIAAISTGFAHLSCIFFGPQCYSAQMAPAIIVESAEANTLLAPIAAIGICLFFIVLGCYALSGAKLIRKLPLLSFGIYAIATVCIIRGILPLQLWIRHPSKVSEAILAVGIVWLLVGLCYLLGYRAVNGKSV